MKAWVVLPAVLLSFGPCAGAAQGRRFILDPDATTLTVKVGKAGLFKFAGHDHRIRVVRLHGEVLADREDLASSSVSVVVEAGALVVVAEGEPPDDVPKVQAKMVGPDLLDVARFPAVTFRSTGVQGKSVGDGAYEVTLAGEFTLHGATKRLTVPVRVEITGKTLVATATFGLRQTDFGLVAVSVAGVVKVKDEVSVECRIAAKEAPDLPATGQGPTGPP